MRSAFLSVFVLFFGFNSVSVVAQIAFSEVTVKRPIPGQAVSAGYFSVANMDDRSRTLVGISTDGADRVEMHTHVHHEGIMSMEKLEYVEVPAGAELRFEPGKNHLMLFSPSEEALKAGVISLEFQFEDGESIAATAEVKDWQ